MVHHLGIHPDARHNITQSPGLGETIPPLLSVPQTIIDGGTRPTSGFRNVPHTNSASISQSRPDAGGFSPPQVTESRCVSVHQQGAE